MVETAAKANMTPRKPFSNLPPTPTSAPPHHDSGPSRSPCPDCGEYSHNRRDCPTTQKRSMDFCVR